VGAGTNLENRKKKPICETNLKNNQSVKPIVRPVERAKNFENFILVLRKFEHFELPLF